MGGGGIGKLFLSFFFKFDFVYFLVMIMDLIMDLFTLKNFELFST